jgi:hypothetical protein
VNFLLPNITYASIGLKLPTSARAYGLAEALYASPKTQSEALYFNPAGLAEMKGRSVSLLYYDGLLDSSYNFIGYARDNITCGIGLLDAGKATIYEFKDPERNIDALKDICLVLATGRKVKDNLSAGIGLKFVHSNLAQEYKTNGAAIDLGILYHTQATSFGAVLKNIGTGLKYEEESSDLPRQLKLGIATDLKERYNLPLELLSSIDIEDKVKLRLGAEYSLSYLALRIGYRTGYDNQGISLGFGLIQKNIGFDYAWTPTEDLDSAHRVSMNIRFWTEKEKKERDIHRLPRF